MQLLHVAEIAGIAASGSIQQGIASNFLNQNAYDINKSYHPYQRGGHSILLSKGNFLFLVFQCDSLITDYLIENRLLLNEEQLYSLLPCQESSAHVRELLIAHPSSSIILIGHSMGGILVQHAMTHIDSKRLCGFIINSPGQPGVDEATVHPYLFEIIHEQDPAQHILSNSRLSGKKIKVAGSYSQQQNSTWLPDFDPQNPSSQHLLPQLIDNMRKQNEPGYKAPVSLHSNNRGNDSPSKQGTKLPGGARSFSELFGDTLR